METEKLFWKDPYIKEFDAKVIKIEDLEDKRFALILDKTAFNPRAGGLVSDTGTINEEKVIEVKKRGEEILHIIDGDRSRFSEGANVHGLINWDRRYRIMRMHTSAHALSALFRKEANALITGNEVSYDRSRIDFNLKEFDKQLMLKLCEKVNEFIKKDLPVKTYFLSRDEALKIPDITKLAHAKLPDVKVLRIVEIEGLDIQADGGPHVKSLKEIGKVVPLKFENKGKGNRRLYYTVEP
jgi:misacylated tRNA(Ala) deacylase